MDPSCESSDSIQTFDSSLCHKRLDSYDLRDSQQSSESLDECYTDETSLTSQKTIRTADIPYCSCDEERANSTDYRRKSEKVKRKGRTIRAKQLHKSKRPNYYCICNTPNRPCTCNRKSKYPSPQKMKREILRNGQKYTYLPNWLVGRLIDIFKEQERKKSKNSNVSDPEILALGVKKGERKKKSDPPKKMKNKSSKEENKHQEKQEKQEKHHGENRNN